MIGPAQTAIVIAVFVSLAFCGGFALAEWRNGHYPAKRVSETSVTPAGYGTRNIKHGYLSHSWRGDKETAEKTTRQMNSDNFVKQTPFEYEVVEMFYRRVK